MMYILNTQFNKFEMPCITALLLKECMPLQACNITTSTEISEGSSLWQTLGSETKKKISNSAPIDENVSSKLLSWLEVP
jgi:hypothetical protein